MCLAPDTPRANLQDEVCVNRLSIWSALGIFILLVGSQFATCPALTMTVGDTYVRTTSTTTFSGKGCGDFKIGDTVGVVGQKSDNIVTATTLSGSN
jgi:hypothetical protein